MDDNQEREVRRWLDDSDPLDWAGEGITPDEWFFVTTLYGEMTVDGQRAHIRTFLPLFVQSAGRGIRNMTPELVADWKLRSRWMKTRLSQVGKILRERNQSMSEYVGRLRRLERGATPSNPMPALDAIITDHRATGWKTLSVFVRDCVQGNSFPIDTRVERSLSLGMGRNPRQIARMFYAAGAEQAIPMFSLVYRSPSSFNEKC